MTRFTASKSKWFEHYLPGRYWLPWLQWDSAESDGVKLIMESNFPRSMAWSMEPARGTFDVIAHGGSLPSFFRYATRTFTFRIAIVTVLINYAPYYGR